MKRIFSVPLMSTLYFFGISASATTFTNENLNITPQPRPLAVTTQAGTTSAFLLEDGNSLRVFRNTIEGVRIWRFELGEVFWWVTDKGIIWGTDMPKDGRYAQDDADAYRIYMVL